MVNDLAGLDNVRNLIQILCKQTSGLNICTLNARSINNKTDELRQIFVKSDVHALLVSETWLHDSIPSSYVSIHGYDLYRNDRCDRRGGGVGIYVNSNFKSKILKCSIGSSLEYICVLIDTGMDKCVLISAYRPPGSLNMNDIDEFVNSLTNLTHVYNNVIVGGDFNVNLLNNDSLSDTFLFLVQSMHLTVVNSLPTYLNCSNPSLLDLLLVTDKDSVLFHNQLSPPSILDHDILFISYNVHIGSNTECNTYSYRDFNSVDLTALSTECVTLPWGDILSDPYVDSKVDKFNTLLSYLFDKYVPLKVIRPKNNSCPWFSQEIKSLIAEREYLYRRWRRLRTSYSHFLYKAARNGVNAAIRNAKRAYLSSKLNPNLPSKTLWTNLKRYGLRKDTAPECNLDPNDMNRFFTSSTSNAVAQSDTSDSTPESYTGTQFSFRCIDFIELYKAVYSVKSNAAGSDGNSPRFIKLLLPLISVYILDIINNCLMSSSFPITWKLARVSPIPKSKSATSFSDYRPISILCFLSKVLEKIMTTQIQMFLNCSNLLYEFQSGFRSKHSCETALLKISTDLRMVLDVGNVGVLVLLDFSKAFDRVDHSMLLKKLSSHFGFSTSAVCLIGNFLTNRSQQVKIKERLSSVLPLSRGVPQGSVLGPLLFCMYINDLPTVVRDAQLHLYADDVQLYLSRPVGLLEDCICRINDDLARISTWSSNNSLQLNPSKSLSIVLHRNPLYSINELSPVILNGSVLPFVNSVSSLGVKFNCSLKCCDHIQAALCKIYGGLRGLWLAADVLPLGLRLKLVKTLLLPYFTYGRLIYPKLDSVCKRKVEVAFNDCIRFAFNLRRSAHITPFIYSLLGCTIDTYLNRKSLVFFHSIIHMREPKYLLDKIEFLQTRRSHSLLIPRYHSSIGEKSYFVQLARLWNALPYNIQSVVSANEFKRRIRQLPL